MMIQSFADLIAVGLSQPEPQALLFVFLRAKEVEAGGAGTRGVLVPAMYTDKLLEAPGFGFAELVAEADQQGAPWDLVMVGALPGRPQQPPVRKVHDAGSTGSPCASSSSEVTSTR